MHEPPAPTPPRPVADPVVATLAESPDEVAKRWLLALVQAAPLASAAAVPVATLAAEAPDFCASVLRAVASDEALAELLSEHAADLVRLSGAGDSPGTVAAAEALRRAAQEAAAAHVPYAAAPVLAALGDRVAHVCARLAAAALSGAPAAGSEPAAPPAPTPPPAPDPGWSPPVARAEAKPAAPLWLAALDRQIADGGRFALLLAEIDGAERLSAAEGEGDAARELFGGVGRAVRGCLRRPDLLAHEEDGRMWIIAPSVGREGAASLAARVADAVRGAAAPRGVPLTASIGVALFPDDGRDAPALTEQAEEGAYAARAAGVRMTDMPDGPPDEDRPAASGPRLVP